MELPQLGHLDREPSILALGEAIRVWEPTLELVCRRDDPLIFEPDGTLYAVGLGPPSTLLARHKPRAFGIGDAIVVPNSVAIEADPPTGFLGLLHEGTPPYHFRERFIQTWGYELRSGLPADSDRVESGGESELVRADDPRFRVPIGVIRPTALDCKGSTGFDLHLLVALDAGVGSMRFGEESIGGERGVVILIPSRTDYVLVGGGTWARLVLRTEVDYLARLEDEYRAEAARWSPEFRPGHTPEA